MSGDKRQLAKNLDYLVQVGDITRAELARLMNVSVTAVGQMIRGDSDTTAPHRLVPVARALGLSLEELITQDFRADQVRKREAGVGVKEQPVVYAPRPRLDLVALTGAVAYVEQILAEDMRDAKLSPDIKAEAIAACYSHRVETGAPMHRAAVLRLVKRA